MFWACVNPKGARGDFSSICCVSVRKEAKSKWGELSSVRLHLVNCVCYEKGSPWKRARAGEASLERKEMKTTTATGERVLPVPCSGRRREGWLARHEPYCMICWLAQAGAAERAAWQASRLALTFDGGRPASSFNLAHDPRDKSCVARRGPSAPIGNSEHDQNDTEQAVGAER